MLEAIAHCHALNVIHRDIQAEKIIITKKDKVKVIGFGLSR
jgi:serine/threonine protein kinase